MSAGKIRQMLAADPHRVLLLDGGMGTTVQDRGIDVQSALWGSFSLVTGEGRAVNDRIHAEFVASGAEILITNTHNARRAKCEEFLLRTDLAQLPAPVVASPAPQRAAALHAWILERATESARGAIPVGAEIAVAGCLGSVEPLGAYATESRISSQEACGRLEPELLARRTLGLDLIVLETLTTRAEIEGIALLGSRLDLGDFAVGLACGPDATTLGGVSMAEVVETLAEARPLVYFIQCTPYREAQAALERLVDSLGPGDVAGVYANDGRRWKDRRWIGERAGPDAYAREAVRWKRTGARVIGGCCGTGPGHIALLGSTLREDAPGEGSRRQR